jgi:23S rRNA pseudouridine2605 synthase
MRINAFVAKSSGLSRRGADQAIAAGLVKINDKTAVIGQSVGSSDQVTLKDKPLTPAKQTITIALNKPVGYVVSRSGQGSQTIYDLLPPEYHRLKPVGRLDKNSSGLLLLTNDGQLANRLTHPRYSKTKVYEVTLDKPPSVADLARVEKGVKLSDGISKLQISRSRGQHFTASLAEGRNRQIRRTFAALGYTVTDLRRTQFGEYRLGDLPACEHRTET